MNDQSRREKKERIRKEDRGDQIGNYEDERKRPTIDQFDRCPKHGVAYPAGGACPKCR